MRPALDQDVIWCQLFSEPDAGSDAAGIKTKATRVDGGWLVNGQKVWTSGAHVAGMGFATVRTNPDVPKHEGITTMVIDMHAEGVEVRPLKMTTRQLGVQRGVLQRRVRARRRRRRAGRRRLDRRPGHARQREREHRRRPGRHVDARRGADRRRSTPTPSAWPAAPPASAATSPTHQAMGLLNLRSANRAVAGGGPGPEGAMTKLVLSELGHEAAAILTELNGPDAAFMDGAGAHEQHARAHAPRHVDRRRHVGDQAQPDRRAHPRPPARPAHQVEGPSGRPLLRCEALTAVEPDRPAVEHRVLDDRDGEPAVLLGLAHALRERGVLGEDVGELVGDALR